MDISGVPGAFHTPNIVELRRFPRDTAGIVPADPCIARSQPEPLLLRVRAAAAAAKACAVAVDADARFPDEAFAEIRRQQLLGILVPQALGGEGVDIAAMVDVCYALGQACASTALIYAMHQVKMACMVRHAKGNIAIQAILRRAATDQLLFASSTTEGNGGGDVRSSAAAIERHAGLISLERKATVISYGMQADGIVTTARRSIDSPANDQVLTVLLKSDYTLERLHGWNTLGMRGTCSEGFNMVARAHPDQILSEPYERIHSHTMVPFSHLAWGSVWAGIAAAATGKAQSFIRHAVRRSKGGPPPGAAVFAQTVSSLRALRGILAAALRSYEAVMSDDKGLTSLEFQSMITLTKVQASELAVATVMSAMRACGLAGYRNDGDFSIGRHLRDVLSGPLMINNERIMTNLAATSLMTALPASISD